MMSSGAKDARSAWDGRLQGTALPATVRGSAARREGEIGPSGTYATRESSRVCRSGASGTGCRLLASSL